MKFPIEFRAIKCTIVIITASLTVSSTNCLSVESLGSPKIWMNRYVERDGFVMLPATNFQNVTQYDTLFASKNGSEYVLSSELRHVEFACEADFPITWILPNVEQFSGVTNFQLRVSTQRASDFENLKQPRNSKYYAYLLIINENYLLPQVSLSGELACQMVDNPSVQSSIYVFTEALNIMEYIGQTVQVNVTSSKSPAIVPCRPSLPTISVSLFKRTLTQDNKMKKSTAWYLEPMNLNESISFNPRVGFILDKNTLQDIYGQYKCVVDGEEEALYAYFQVVAGTEPNTDFIPRNEITSNHAKLTYGRGFVQCCTSNLKSPAIGDSFICNNAAECDLFKPLFMYDVSAGRRLNPLQIYNKKKINILPSPKRNSNCYRTNLPLQSFHQSKLFLCSGSGIDVVAHFVTAFTSVDYTFDKPATAQRNALLQRQYDVFDLTHNNNMTISNKIRFEIEAPLLGLYPPQVQFSEFWNQHGQKYNNIFNQFSTHPLVTLGRRKQNRLVRAHRRPLYAKIYRDNLFEGESLLVTCMTHPFFYAKGGWLRLNWKNGTQSVFPQVDLSELMFAQGLYTYGDSVARLEILNTYSSGNMGVDYIRARIPNVDLEMKSLDCFAPVWNSEKWEMHSYEMNVKPTDLPVLEDLSTETLIVKMNQTGVQLRCTMEHNLTNPSARLIPMILYWEKNGQMIFGVNEIGSIGSFRNGSTIIVTLMLFPVSHITHGEYHCVARNVRGAVKKVFKVFVDDESSKVGTLMIISGICTLSLFVTIVGILIWRHWHLRVNISRILAR